MSTTYHLSKKSNNAKTGPIPVSTTSGNTCPDACPLKRDPVTGKAGPCYAKGGPLAMHWAKVSSGERGTNLEGFLAELRALPPDQLWRHNQAGDLPGLGDAIDTRALYAITLAQAGRRGFTYTHKPVASETAWGADPVHVRNGIAIAAANAGGFTVNLSADNVQEADELAKLGIGPVVTLLPTDITEAHVETPEGRRVVVCPAQRTDTSCAKCQLCSVRDRKVIVGFLAHGASHKKAGKIAALNVLA